MTASKAWEQHLEETYRPRTRHEAMPFTSHEVDWLLGQGILVAIQGELKYLLSIQLDLEGVLDLKRKTDHFESKWLAMSPQTRESHILKSLVYSCDSRNGMENRRIWCPETTMKYLQQGGGNGFLSLLATICPRKSKMEPRSQPVIISHAIFEASQGIGQSLLPGDNQAAREVFQRHTTISRNIFLSFFLYNTMTEIYGRSHIPYVPIKPSLKPADPRRIFQGTSPDGFKAWKHASKHELKSAQRACEDCGTLTSELPDGKVFMQCLKCKGIGRKIVYCNRCVGTFRLSFDD